METMSSEIFSGAICVCYSYMIHVQHFVQFPIIYLYFTIYAGGVLQIMPVRRRYCDDDGVLVL